MSRRRPPRIAAAVLERVLDGRHREYVLGDLAEEYERLAGSRGERAARAWYRREVLRALVPALRHRFGREEVVMGGVDGWKRGMIERLRTMSGDARLACRAMMRRPGWVFAVLLTLGVAIGSNAATFGVVDAVLLRGLPYPEEDRIVSFSEVHAERLQDLGWASIPNYVDWREQSRSFGEMSLFRGRSMSLTGEDDPLYVYGAYVTASFFDVFGAPAQRGRTFTDGDAEAASGSVVVSHGLWQRRFGGDPSIVGEAIVIDGITRVVIGIMPASFNAPGEWIDPQARMDVWVPITLDAAQESRASRSYNVVGRLAPRVTLDEARTEMSRISADLAQAYPEENEGWEVRLLPWKEVVVGYTRRLLFPLWGAMGVMLLVACANVGNLVLNRSLARRSEFATRAALGAGGGRLFSQAVIESLILGLSGAVLGLLIAWGMLSVVRVLDPGNLPRLSEAVINLRVALGTSVLALVVSAGLAVIPAWRTARSDVHEALRQSVRVGGAGRGTRRARDAMVVLQLALALALLAGSALVLRGFLRMRDVSPGFDPDGVLSATVALSWDRVSEPEQRAAFTRDVLTRLRALPGVESAAMINSLPFSGSNQQQTFAIEGQTDDGRSPPFASLRGVSPDYLATMRIPLLRGRDFTDADLAVPARVVLINDALAKRYLGDTNPIGERLVLFAGDVIAEIVGITGDVRHFGLDQSVMPEIYVPYTTDVLTSKSYVMRTSGDPLALAASVRAAIHDVDPAQPLRATGRERAETMTMRALVDASLAGPRFHTLVLILLSAVALLLAAVGLFATVAISVTERRREIGLRMALGAERRRVMIWMLARVARIAAIAIVLGLLVTMAAGRTLEALLFGASARDPVILAAAVLAFGAITLAAVILPAGRILGIDPANELRQQ